MANSTKISEYSTTAANNTSIDSIDIDENCAASGINNAIRSVLKHQADAFTQGTPIALDQTNNRVGIGTTSPGGSLEVYKAGTSEVLIGTDNGGTAQLSLYEANDGTKEGLLKYDGTNNRIHLATSGNANALVIPRDSGNVGIGTSAPATTAHIQTSSGNPELRIESTGANYATVSVKNSSRHYSTQIRTDQSNAYVVRDETAGANRFAIDTSGNVGIGTSTPASLLEIKAAALNRANGIALRGSGANDVLYMYPSADNVATIEHLIDGSTSTGGNIVINPQGGDVQLGTTTNHGDNNQGGVTFQAATFDRMIMNIGHTDGSSRPVVRFFGNASESSSGNISCNGSSTAYNTSSDARLKDNVADMTGAIDRVKALAPKRFNFIADADTTVDGFLAHEAQAVVPEAVTGTHNEVDEDGNAVMQGIDQSKLVPLLTGALREAIAKIETLETEMTALKARVTALEA